jgi:hypothetical protein
MTKTAIRPVTRKNLLVIDKENEIGKHIHSDAFGTCFLDVVKASTNGEKQPGEATTTDGTIYS